MKKKLLCCALLAGIGMVQSAQAYDDRWYVGAGVGVTGFDRDRDVTDDMYGVIGLGKMVSPRISIDAELWHTDPDHSQFNTRNWELLSLSIVGRYHWIEEGRRGNPYVLLGLGAQEHHDGTPVIPPQFGYGHSRVGTDVVALAGFGATWDLGYPYLRTEVGLRLDLDDGGVNDQDTFVDYYAGVQFLFPIGPESEPAPPPAPIPQKTCADLDDDGDGVNNCDDKCPGSSAGQAIGPDGCPVPAPEPEPVMEPKPFRG